MGDTGERFMSILTIRLMVKMLKMIGGFMTIEISEEKYWKLLNYYDGMLYLTLLTIDGKDNWRMLKKYDEFYFLSTKINLEPWKSALFSSDETQYPNDAVLKIIPVRDI